MKKRTEFYLVAVTSYVIAAIVFSYVNGYLDEYMQLDIADFFFGAAAGIVYSAMCLPDKEPKQ